MYQDLQAGMGENNCSIECKDLCVDLAQQQAISYLRILPREAKITILREYLIAATAKDCSIMIAFRAAEKVNLSGSIALEYAVHVADLEFKPLSKVGAHYQLDCEILNTVRNGDMRIV